MNFIKSTVILSMAFFVPLQVAAHPHSFIDLKNKVLVENTLLKGFQMEWTMDEIASAELIYELNQSADKAETTKSITAEMTQTAIENHYFSYLYDAQKQPIKFTAEPSNTEFKIHGNRVTFYVTFYVARPYELKNNPVHFYTYEPSYYMGMEYNRTQDLSVSENRCQATLTQPQVDNALRLYASGLDKNQSPEPAAREDESLGAKFAQKVSIVCE